MSLSCRWSFRYLTAGESIHYLAATDLLAGTLVTDLSATEVAAQPADRGRVLGREVTETRCRQLVEWGNLVQSIRNARVSSRHRSLRATDRAQPQPSRVSGR